MIEFGFKGFEAVSREQVTSLLYAMLFILLLFSAYKRSWPGAISTIIGFAFVLIFVSSNAPLKALSNQMYRMFTGG